MRNREKASFSLFNFRECFVLVDPVRALAAVICSVWSFAIGAFVVGGILSSWALFSSMG
jgi:hypothetical protein